MSANTRIFEAVFRFRSFFYEIAHEVGSILHQPLFFRVHFSKIVPIAATQAATHTSVRFTRKRLIFR